MKNLCQEYVVQELGGKFVVVDRQLWEQEKPDVLLSLIGSSRLAAELDDEQAAQQECQRLNAGLSKEV